MVTGNTHHRPNREMCPEGGVFRDTPPNNREEMSLGVGSPRIPTPQMVPPGIPAVMKNELGDAHRHSLQW